MIITIISFKGGVGKSMIAQNIAVSLIHRGEDTCIIDADPNQNTTDWLTTRGDAKPDIPVYTLGERANITQTITNLSSKYKYVIVDCPPEIQQTTSRAVLKSDVSIIPLPTTGGADLWATERFLQNLESLRDKLDIEIPSFILANRYRQRLNMHQHLIQSFNAYTEAYRVNMLETVFPELVGFGEANLLGKGVQEIKATKASKLVNTLVDEILQTTNNLTTSHE